MAVFPNPAVQLLLNGVWTDITADAFVRDSIVINRGRADESGHADPSRCTVTLNNKSGVYSPRNPSGAHFGAIGRNTPFRVLTPATLDNHLVLPGHHLSYADTPDAAALDITGDIDIRIDVHPPTWRPTDDTGLARKYYTSGNQKSWAFWLDETGHLRFWWSANGSGTLFARANAPIPAASGRLGLRVTLDVDNGAAGNTAKFYTAPSIDGPWTQIGITWTQSGTTSIFASTAPVEVGRVTGPSPAGGITSTAFGGKIYGFELRSGIDGTAVASPDFTAADSGDGTLTDAQGRVWTFHGSAVLANPNARFHGEVSAWPQKWDTSGEDVWVPIEAAGVMRRLGQGASALKSTLYRALTTLAANKPVGYWPMEDGGDATEFASGLPGGEAAHGAGDADLATFTGFKASSPLPQLKAARVGCNVPGYSHTGEHQTRFLLAVPSGGVAAETSVVRIYTATGSVAWWELRVKSDGALILRAMDSEGAELFNSGPMAFAVNGKLLRVSVELDAVGADTHWDVLTLEAGQPTGLSLSGTLAGRVVGAVRRVGVNSEGGLGDTAFGHLSVQSTITSLYDLHEELNAYTGEPAGTRILRLCLDEGLPLTVTGDLADTARMGPQLPKTLLDLLREAAETDMGILYEPRTTLGVAYRTRTSLYAQAADLALDYASGHLSAIEPVDDDQATRNDVTAAREGGGSARAELTTGALSTAAPPDGVGRYDDEVTLSIRRDEDLPHQASWRLHLGTVDEARYPVLGVNLAATAFTGNPTLTAAAKALDVGDKLTVTNIPGWLPPDDIRQIAQGFTETISPPSGVPYRHPWTIDVNCSPAAPWDVAVYDATSGPGEARYSSDGSTLAAGLTTTATSVSVATPAGPLWSSTDQPFDIYVGGERMRVTAVTGASSPQTFTVIRSVNGVVKTHLTGAEVRLFKPAYYAL